MNVIILDDLKIFESVSQAQQQDGKAMVSVERFRTLFDGFIAQFAEEDEVTLALALSLSLPLSLTLSLTLSLPLSLTLSLSLSLTLSLIQVIGSYIKSNADIMHSPNFESDGLL